MKLFLRPTHLCVMAVCLCQALSASPFALCQATPAAEQQDQKAQSAPQTPVSNNTPLKEDWNGQIDAFGLLEGVAGQCREYRRHIEEGKPSEKEPFWTMYIGWLGLREDEGQELCTISIDVVDRTKELVHQFYAAHGGKTNVLMHTPPSAEWNALEQRKRMVTVEAIAKLKQQLTKVSYKRLELYFYDEHCNGNHHVNGTCSDAERNLIYPATPSAAVPSSRKLEENSAPAQVPEVQQ
jgi:hypothetical protein